MAGAEEEIQAEHAISIAATRPLSAFPCPFPSSSLTACEWQEEHKPRHAASDSAVRPTAAFAAAAAASLGLARGTRSGQRRPLSAGPGSERTCHVRRSSSHSHPQEEAMTLHLGPHLSPLPDHPVMLVEQQVELVHQTWRRLQALSLCYLYGAATPYRPVSYLVASILHVHLLVGKQVELVQQTWRRLPVASLCSLYGTTTPYRPVAAVMKLAKVMAYLARAGKRRKLRGRWGRERRSRPARCVSHKLLQRENRIPNILFKACSYCLLKQCQPAATRSTVEPRSKVGVCPFIGAIVLSSTAVVVTSPSIFSGYRRRWWT